MGLSISLPNTAAAAPAPMIFKKSRLLTLLTVNRDVSAGSYLTQMSNLSRFSGHTVLTNAIKWTWVFLPLETSR
jgi:hypothetical protein